MTSADTDAAIVAALSSNWEKALEINNRILVTCPDDLDCLNRIGKAYLELGDYKKAAIFFRKVLKINKYDQIATRNLAKVTQSSAPKKSLIQSKNNSGSHFFN
jgi:tetratricopeptide (TPR) repeat protein